MLSGIRKERIKMVGITEAKVKVVGSEETANAVSKILIRKFLDKDWKLLLGGI